MRLENKLENWVKNSLITSTQKQDILMFEHSLKNSCFFSGIVLLGAFVMTLGIISLVAANWEGISAIVKIMADLMVIVGISIMAYYCCRKNKIVAFEAWVLALFMAVGASIGLIGQVFQLGNSDGVWLFWCLLTVPLLMISKLRILPVLWIALLLFGICCYFDEWLLLIWRIIANFELVEKIPVLGLVLILAVGGGLIWIFKMFDKKFDYCCPVYSVAIFYNRLIMYMVLIDFVCVYTFEVDILVYLSIIVVAAGFLAIDAYVCDKNRNYRRFNLDVALLYWLFLMIYFRVMENLMFTGMGLIISGSFIIGSLYSLKYLFKRLRKRER